MTDNDSALASMPDYPIETALRLSSRMLDVMLGILEGKQMDDALYDRVFGTKEGMVQQLQRVCDVLTDVRALEMHVKPVGRCAVRVSDEEEQALIRHYVVQMAKQLAQDANAGDVSLE
ncbi:MAG: hypothetical protein C0436_02315 [Alphaproteobacteria bacterium]|nr:hypothetical protein [Alphaproteobacteria bacterium]